jgi:hypothetical protein
MCHEHRWADLLEERHSRIHEHLFVEPCRVWHLLSPPLIEGCGVA